MLRPTATKDYRRDLPAAIWRTTSKDHSNTQSRSAEKYMSTQGRPENPTRDASRKTNDSAVAVIGLKPKAPLLDELRSSGRRDHKNANPMGPPSGGFFATFQTPLWEWRSRVTSAPTESVTTSNAGQFSSSQCGRPHCEDEGRVVDGAALFVCVEVTHG